MLGKINVLELSGLRPQTSGCRGEAKPSRFLRKSGRGQALHLHQVIYNQSFVEIPKRTFRRTIELSGLGPQTSGCRGGACPRPGEAKPSRFLRRAGGGKPFTYLKSFIIKGLWKVRNV